jgi:hypothetical protein
VPVAKISENVMSYIVYLNLVILNCLNEKQSRYFFVFIKYLTTKIAHPNHEKSNLRNDWEVTNVYGHEAQY